MYCLIHGLVSNSLAKHALLDFTVMSELYICPDLIARLGNNNCLRAQAKDPNTGTGSWPRPGSTRPRACTRFGTGVLPIVTRSLLAVTLNPTSQSDQPISSTNPGLPQSTVLQPYSTETHRSPVQSEATGEHPTPSQSTDPGSQSVGKVQWEAVSHQVGDGELTADNAAIEVDLADAQPLDGNASEQHVWGAMLTQSHGTVSETAEDRIRTMSSQSTRKKRGAERAVTPRTLNK